MRPKRWIDPSADRNVREGDLRIVRLEDGTVRATKWVQYSGSTHGYYADSKGDGVCSSYNQVAAVGVTWERKRSGPSGPSGKHLVPQRAVRIPTDLWERFRAVATERGTDRNTAINELVERYCS